jgi:cyclophilin family peptidyl-prolyl cis-trans isomerase
VHIPESRVRVFKPYNCVAKVKKRSMRSFGMFVAVVLALGLIAGACKSNSTKQFVGRDSSVSFSEVCQKSAQKQFSKPDTVIDTAKTYVATIKTAKGDIVIQLFSDVPVTANNFAFLACKGFYDGVTFHRVIPGFVAQGGDLTGSGSGGPGYAIPDESSNGHKMDAGVISMAKAGANTTGSQFFITYTPQPGLESGFTVFGKVTSGMDVALSLTPRDPSTNPNAPPGDTITSITIAEQ